MAGLPVTQLNLDEFGPANDRRWLVVDSDDDFVTQRTEPRLALVGVSIGLGDTIHLALPGMESIELTAGTESLRVRVWSDYVEGLLESGSASAALSAWLGRELRFVYMPKSAVRPADPMYVNGNRRVSFADGFPFLILTEASFQALDNWSGEAWDTRRFRPGIVIDGAEAFAEDRWRWLRIGDAVLECVKPCSRCVLTTVDPDTGVVHERLEPLRTLGRHRRTSAGVLFGQNAVHWLGSVLAVGDTVELLDGSPL